MIIAKSLSEIPFSFGPVALTIGFFDGVHAGHRFLFSELKKRGRPAAITFSNHPSEALGKKTPRLLTTLQEKLSLLQECKVELVIVLPFTKELAATSYIDFLQQVKDHLDFRYLVLGKGDALGKGREGDEVHLQLLEDELDFQAVFLPKLSYDGEPISSERIRRQTERILL